MTCLRGQVRPLRFCISHSTGAQHPAPNSLSVNSVGRGVPSPIRSLCVAQTAWVSPTLRAAGKGAWLCVCHSHIPSKPNTNLGTSELVALGTDKSSLLFTEVGKHREGTHREPTCWDL